MDSKHYESCFFKVLIGATCLIMLVMGGFAYIYTYLLVKDFLPAQCIYLHEKNHGQVNCSYCSGDGDECKSKMSSFPCVEIKVECPYWTGNLYEDIYTLKKFYNSENCSYYFCSDNKPKNNQKFADFIKKWQSTKLQGPVPCFYNKYDHRQVIEDRGLSPLWLLLISFLSIIILGICYYYLPRILEF